MRWQTGEMELRRPDVQARNSPRPRAAEMRRAVAAVAQPVRALFDRYRRELEQVELPPQLRAAFLLHVGEGYYALGHPDAAVPFLQSAIAFAAEHQLNQIIFE